MAITIWQFYGVTDEWFCADYWCEFYDDNWGAFYGGIWWFVLLKYVLSRFMVLTDQAFYEENWWACFTAKIIVVLCR